MAIPESELRCPAGTGLKGHERRQGPLVSPTSQNLLNHPDQTRQILVDLHKRAPFEAPHYSRDAQPIKVLLDPLMAVLGYKIINGMLADRETKTILTPPSRITDIPILETISSTVMKTHTKDGFGSQNESPFVIAQMERLNPYFEQFLEGAIQGTDPYAPVWQAYATLTPIFANALSDPARREFYKSSESDRPISSLHRTLWEGVATIPAFATALPPFIYSDTVETVRQFQQQAIDRGVLGILAKAPEIIKTPRNRVVAEGNGSIPSRYFEQDPETGIIQYRDDDYDKDGYPLKANLAKLIREGLTLCAVPYGLRDPSTQIRDINRGYNSRVGLNNRTSSHFLPIDHPEEIQTTAEALALETLLTAPSTLWLPFLDAKGITDWKDAFPGTRLPNGSVKHGKMSNPPTGVIFAS